MESLIAPEVIDLMFWEILATTRWLFRSTHGLLLHPILHPMISPRRQSAFDNWTNTIPRFETYDASIPRRYYAVRYIYKASSSCFRSTAELVWIGQLFVRNLTIMDRYYTLAEGSLSSHDPAI